MEKSANNIMTMAMNHYLKGDFKIAEKYFRAVIKDSALSEKVRALKYIVSFTRYKDPNHSDIRKLKKLLPKCNEEHKAHAYYTLGKAYDDCKKYDMAFSFYQKANDIRHKTSFLNRKLFSKQIDQIIKFFNEDLIKEHSKSGSQSHKPVFIIGLPRSGTTLMEQILASHSRIAPGGELKYARDLFKSLDLDNQKSFNQRKLVTSMDYYLEKINKISDLERVTDKFPANYIYLGFIHLMFPEAHIIHCVRDKMDTFLSNYFQDFAEGKWANSFDDLEFFYQQYQRLITHWKSIFPENIIDVSYEALVNDLEEESKRLIGAIDLEWEDSCLEYHNSKNVVTTASAWQVRQPIYKGSIGRWKNYEKYLKGRH